MTGTFYPRRALIFIPLGLKKGSARERTELLMRHGLSLRPSNLLEGLGVCQVILHSLPASPQMTGEWTRPQGGLRVITLAELLLSSDCVTGTENPEKENKRLTK